MKILINTLFFFLFILFLTEKSGIAASKKGGDISPPGPNEVHIAPNGIVMPLERILLIHKSSEYCALKFIKFWMGKTQDDRYAEYESYCQDDKTLDFGKGYIKIHKKELRSPKPSFSIFGHPFAFDIREEIDCGPIKLGWSGIGSVYFFERDQHQGDYGIELAPTPWTEISQVNVFDSRVKWYRYDEKRERMNIPVDKLWEK